MKVTPTKDAPGWASFNNRFRLILSPFISAICFLIVWAGSIYGIERLLEPQFLQWALPLAAALALLVQGLNRVAVHFSTRMIASLFVFRAARNNTHQKIAGPDIFLGLVALCITALICVVDFYANKEGNERLAETITAKPEPRAADTRADVAIIDAAKLAVESERAAEATERAAWDTKVDLETATERRRLETRRTQITGKTWAGLELKNIERQLSKLESIRRDRKAAFVPKKSNVAACQAELAGVSAKQSQLMQAKSAVVDTINHRETGKYYNQLERRSSGLFLIYLAAMLIWHLCHGFRAFRALRYDEIHPDGDNALFAIFQTLNEGLTNKLWKIRATIYDWMPEEEIRGLSKIDAIQASQTGLCSDIYNFILSNQNCNEMAIYVAFRNQDLKEVRNSLKILKTAKLAHETSGLWHADASQAQFFPATAAFP